MTREELYVVANDATNDSELDSRDIPSIDLYVDQIINLVQTKLEEGSSRYRDCRLTKTMINNYSKDGLITPIKGKKYNKEQVLQILTVYTLKNSISIGEIKRLLCGAYQIEGFDGDSLEKIYQRHQDIKQDNRDYIKELLDRIIEKNQLDLQDDIDYIVSVCSLLSLSTQLKNIARAMIDSKYPEPVEEETEDKKDKEKKEKKEEKIKEKKEKKKKEEDNGDDAELSKNS